MVGSASTGDGRVLDDQVQQLLDADLLAGVREDDGDERAGLEGLDEHRRDLFRLDLLAAQVALHQGIVRLDHALDQLRVGVRHVHHGRAAGAVLDTVDHGILVRRGQVGAAALRAERLLNRGDQLWEFDILGIHLVDDDHPRLMRLAGEVEELAGIGLDAGGGADDEDRRLGGGNGDDRRADEVGVSGRIDHVDPLAVVLRMDDRGENGVLMLLLLVVVVADGRLVIDAPQPVDGAGRVQDGLGDRGLAAAAMS